MKLNFSNNHYKERALKTNIQKENIHTTTDAFFLLINGLSIQDLSNLCNKMVEYYKSIPNPINLTMEDCYRLTQNMNLNELEKKTIEELAYKCIKEGKYLGSKTINDGKINTSSWINHCFYSGEVCAILATELNLDIEFAKVLGMLHDYGRKFDHTFNHTIKGFEALSDLGWDNEAIGCLTHSFVNGGRCCNNEPALENFFVDKDGNAKWTHDVVKDDMTLFLDNYKYTYYDVLLNIADLMATDKGIVSPKERIEDIATRRVIDPTNRGYFLANITNTFITILQTMDLLNKDIQFIYDDENTSIESITTYFNQVSNYFFDNFSNMQTKNKVKR